MNLSMNSIAYKATACIAACFMTVSIAHAAAPTKYTQTCGVCHDTGNLGAPKKGDKAAWAALKSQKGMDGLVQSTKQGMPQMPAKGLCNDCTDQDFVAMIEYMSQ